MVLLVVGIIFTLFSFGLFRAQRAKKRLFNVVEGRIVGYIARESRSRRSGRQTFYHPVAEYVVGQPHRVASEIGSSSFSYEIGATVRVMHHPKNPEDADIVSWGYWIFIGAFGIAGLGALIGWYFSTDFNNFGASISPAEGVFWLMSLMSLGWFLLHRKKLKAETTQTQVHTAAAAQAKRTNNEDLWNDNLFVDAGNINRWRGIENTVAKIGGLIGIGLCIWLMHREGGLIPLIELYKTAWETQSLDVKPGILIAGLFSCVLMLGGLINVFRR